MGRRDDGRMLNLEQVRTFLAVASHLHFGKAADDLFISQSAVSASIAKLESQLRVPLFHRIGRRVQLTDAGRFLQRDGQRLMDQARRLELDLDDFNGLRRGSLHLGASFTVGNYWLPIHLTTFRERFPAIQLHCELGNAETILEGTNAGRFDLGFLTGRPPAGAATVVGEESLTLVVGRAHPWFGTPPRQLHQLLESAWLIREPGSGTRQMLESWLRRMGLSVQELRVQLELRSNEMVKTMVGSGSALGALPSSMVAREIAAEVLWPITPKECALEAEAIWMVRSPNRQDSRILNQFVAIVQAEDAEGDRVGLRSAALP
ncbi:MAG: LysR substrate-binding domain-containing protein [Cyanobacteriota bacterium]